MVRCLGLSFADVFLCEMEAVQFGYENLGYMGESEIFSKKKKLLSTKNLSNFLRRLGALQKWICFSSVGIAKKTF